MIDDINTMYSTSDRKKISKDWEELFPSLKKYKTLDWNNRIGPLITGVYLKVVRSSIYTPVYYVHNLCREFPAITSTLMKRGQSIKPLEHNQKYIQVANCLKKELYIPIEGDLYIEDIIDGYKRYFKSPNIGTYIEYEDLALICGWTKREDLIEKSLKKVYEELKNWPEERYFIEEGGFKAWFCNLEKRAWDGNELNKIFRLELEKHKLEKLPERKIIY